MLKNWLIICVVVSLLFFLFKRSVRHSTKWRATLTPLASIIGSGFLVIAPLLVLTVGRFLIVGICVLVFLGYACGAVIRFNIHNLEPLLASGNANRALLLLERVSNSILGIAYIISVTFYIQLLAAFLLRGFQIEDAILGKIIASIVLASIGICGQFRGLKKLEDLEEYSVSVKLAIIGGLIFGLVFFNLELLFTSQWRVAIPNTPLTIESIRILLGSLIVVQGFETSRFLGSRYSALQRTNSMRSAQLLAGIIYISFIALIAVVFRETPHISDTEIIDLSQRVASILPMLLIGAAIMSQFSAAVADTIGSGGLLMEILRKRVSLGNSYLLIAILAIMLTWSSNIFEIISLASRAFAVYYCTQTIEAIYVSYKKRYWVQSITFGLLLLPLIFVAVSGMSAKV